MDYNKQIKEITNYFKASEKKEDDFKIGIEFEHFVIDKDRLKTISYYGKNGVAETLKDLEQEGWIGIYEEGYILGLNKDNKEITLEPGSQLEFSILPEKNIENIEKEYFQFLNEIIPILEKKNQGLIAIGYHPETKIEDIKILPMNRYDYMFNYFKDKGFHAHNMMKGTASVQLAFDFSSEEDFVKKFQTTNALSSVIYAMFDNGFYFEGERWHKHNLRSHIWENCDNDRSGIVDGTFDSDFGYEKYAEYILNTPPIFINDGEKEYLTGDKLYKEIFNPENYNMEELEHALTMVFPDVRTKKYIEIRMMDSIPYPLNLSIIALWKGIIYNKENLDIVYDYIKDINMGDINKSKADIKQNGLDGKLKDQTVSEWSKKLVKIAKSGLDQDEVKYILPLEEMVNNKLSPAYIIESQDHLGKKEAIKDCILNNIIEVN